MWSLQYLAAGPICASAGVLARFAWHAPPPPLPADADAAAAAPAGTRDSPPSSSSGASSSNSRSSDGDSAPSPRPPPTYSHAVLFRYASQRSLAAFLASPRVALMLSGMGLPEAQGGWAGEGTVRVGVERVGEEQGVGWGG